MKTEKIIEAGVEYTVLMYKNGYQRWFFNNKLHRELGPAEITYQGTQKWFMNDELHRTDGPAIIWFDDIEEWWYQGKYIEVHSQQCFEQWLKLKVFS